MLLSRHVLLGRALSDVLRMRCCRMEEMAGYVASALRPHLPERLIQIQTAIAFGALPAGGSLLSRLGAGVGSAGRLRRRLLLGDRLIAGWCLMGLRCRGVQLVVVVLISVLLAMSIVGALGGRGDLSRHHALHIRLQNALLRVPRKVRWLDLPDRSRLLRILEGCCRLCISFTAIIHCFLWFVVIMCETGVFFCFLFVNN